jgi:hypothetical protein
MISGFSTASAQPATGASMSTATADRDLAPCLIGTARRTWHPGTTEVPEPLAMWEEMARSAAEDAGARVDPIAHIDDLSVVHCQSWAYDDAPRRLAERLGRPEATRHESILAGTSPQRLIDAAAERMVAGARCYARSSAPDTIDAVARGAWVTDATHLAPASDGTNELRW